MHAGSLQIRWLTFSGENWAVFYPYSLGNIIQFHELLSDPKDLDLTRHEERLVRVEKNAAIGGNEPLIVTRSRQLLRARWKSH